MAYDEELAHRIRAVLASDPGITERSMFGGLGFMVDGKMALAAGSRGALMVRVDPADGDRLAAQDGVEPTVMRGGPIKGWLDVVAGALEDDADLRRWVRTGVDYARSLPAKR